MKAKNVRKAKIMSAVNNQETLWHCIQGYRKKEGHGIPSGRSSPGQPSCWHKAPGAADKYRNGSSLWPWDRTLCAVLTSHWLFLKLHRCNFLLFADRNSETRS